MGPEGIGKQELTPPSAREAASLRLRGDKITVLSRLARERYADLIARLG